jgi:hypothetical protein
MALGAIWCPKEAVKTLSSEIAELKRQHGAEGELKWGKVSPAKMGFYEALIAWFVEKKRYKVSRFGGS